MGILALQLYIRGLNRTKSLFNLLDIRKIDNEYESNITGKPIKHYDKKLFEKETIFYVLDYYQNQTNTYRNRKRIDLNRDYIEAYGIKNPSRFKLNKIFTKLKRNTSNKSKDSEELDIFIDFIKQCLQVEIQKRISINDLLKHKFLN